MTDPLYRQEPVTLPAVGVRYPEASKILGISQRVLANMVKRGEIPCVRVGRSVVFPVELLKKWLCEQCRNSGDGAL